MSRLRLGLGPALFTLALLAAVAGLGQIPISGASPHAQLRLALRTVQARIETCRELSAGELAALPQHMRTPTVCTELAPNYRLVVTLDGEVVLDEEVAPGGWRGDRPLIVDRRLDAAPGPAALSIHFAPQVDPSLPEEEVARLPHYELASQVEFAAGRITLVTLDKSDVLRLVSG
jgi:hypothetical protein